MKGSTSAAWRSCHVFYDGNDLMETSVFLDAWNDLLVQGPQPSCCCAYPETSEFLALAMAMIGLDTIAKSTWTIEDERAERRAILQQYETTTAEDGDAPLAMEHRGIMMRLVWKAGASQWKLHYRAGKIIRRQRRGKELYVAKVPKANQSPTEVSLLPEVFAEKHLLHRRLEEEQLIGDREQEWPVQSGRRKAFLSRLLGKQETKIPWETNTSAILLAPLVAAEEVFRKTEVSCGGVRLPLGELLTVEFRHQNGHVDLFWEHVRQYPDKTSKKISTKPQRGVRMRFRVSAQPILQVVEDLETLQRVWQKDRECVDVTRLVVWTVCKAQQQPEQLEVLVKEHVPFLLNCCGNYRIYIEMQDWLETPVACLGLHQSVAGFGGAHDVLCKRVPLEHYNARDDARFRACMTKLAQLDPEQRNAFRMCAFAIHKRLVHEIRFAQRPDTQDMGIPAEEYQEKLAEMKAIITSTADPERNRVQREVYSLVEKFYLALCGEGGKHAALRSLLCSRETCTKNIVLITPKAAAWSAAVRNEFPNRRLRIVTARTYDPHISYDLVIVTGHMTMGEDPGDAFSRIPLGWNAEETVFLLYDFETAWGERTMQSWERARDTFQRAAGLVAPSEQDVSAPEPEALLPADDWETIERRLPSWDAQLQAYWGTKGRIGDQKAHVMALATLADGRHLLIGDAKNGRKPFQAIVSHEDDAKKITLRELRGKDVQPGMRFIYAKDYGTRGELLQTFFQALGAQGWDPADLACVQEWQQGLQRYRKEYQLTWEDLRQELNTHGADIGNTQTLRSWLIADSTVLGPEQKKKTQVFQAIGAVLPSAFRHHTWQEYLAATDRVRDVRRTLQHLMTEEIPKAYVAKRNGEAPASSRQQVLMDHLEEVCDVYEVETVQPLSLIVSQNIVNKPLEDVPIPKEGEQE